MRGAGLLMLAVSVPLLSGCLAAAAIPVAAGAVVVRSRAVQADPAAVSRDAAPQPVGVSTILTNLPPPDASPHGAAQGAIARMRDYVLARQSSIGEAGKPVESALLARPGDLTGQRAPCRSRTKAVFVDLDPGRGTFDALSPGVPDDALADALATLRGQGITVVWFSRAGENFDAAVRQALRAAGFDPAGRDQLVLMRTIEDRKQTRRDALAEFLCPIALVGDDKADFDELFLYLKNADAALALDRLIGNGWFIARPFSSPAPPAAPQQPTDEGSPA